MPPSSAERTSPGGAVDTAGKTVARKIRTRSPSSSLQAIGDGL